MCLNTQGISNVPSEDTLKLTEEELATKRFNYIVLNCKFKKKIYSDMAFPLVPSSLYYSPAENTNANLVQWRRIRNTAADSDKNLPWAVFRSPSSHDVFQGKLHNCWLLSALAVIALKGDLLKSVLISHELCPQGAYLVRLCKYGEWNTVIIDDFMPCDDEGNLLYAEATKKQLWIPLIEKAVAKLYGCYESLETGRSLEGFSTLTGAPCEIIQLQRASSEEIFDVDLIWSQLLSFHQSGFLMAVSCGAGNNMNVDELEYKRRGLHPRHAYSILDVQNAGEHQLLNLRNPWGTYEWTGDFSYDSEKWNYFVRSKLMKGFGNDGTFWISFPDFLKYFDGVDVCKIRRGWNEMRVSGLLPPSQQPLSWFRLSILETTEVDLTLYQNGQRNVNKLQRLPSDLCVALFKAHADCTKIGDYVISSCHQINAMVGCYKLLEVGDYLVVPLAFNHWGIESLVNRRYVLAIHSSKKVLANPILPPPKLLGDVMISLILTQAKRYQERENIVVYYLTRGWNGCVIMVDNNHQYKWLHIKCDFQGSINISSTRGSLKTVDSVPPLHRQIIIVLTQTIVSENCMVIDRIKHEFSDNSDFIHNPALNDANDQLHIPRSMI